MGLKARRDIALYSATRMEDILRAIVTMRPVAAIVDSIQTVYLDGVTGSAGSVSQASLSYCAKHTCIVQMLGGRAWAGSRKLEPTRILSPIAGIL